MTIKQFRSLICCAVLLVFACLPSLPFPALATDIIGVDVDEMMRIERHAGFVKRDGDRLYLRLKRGGYVVMADLQGCVGWDSCRLYEFLDYFKERGFYNVYTFLGEPSEFLMISDLDGSQYVVYGEAKISPGGERFVTVSASEAFDINGVFVWRFEDGRIVPELHYEPKEYALYSFLGWKDGLTVSLSKLVHSDRKRCPASYLMAVPVTLELVGKKWVFNDDMEAVKCGDIMPGTLTAVEYENREKFAGLFKRKDDILSLRLRSGAFIDLVGLEGCPRQSGCGYLSMVDYYKERGFYLIAAGYFSPDAYFMVSDGTGRAWRLGSRPVFSPGGLSFVETKGGRGTGEKGIFVWRLEGEGLRREYSHEEHEFRRYSGVSWRDESTVTLSEQMRSDAALCPGSYVMTVPLVLTFNGQGWLLREDLTDGAVTCDGADAADPGK